MANFARSLKSPSYLSPRLRPSMPSRSLSNSSDVSVASNNSTRSEDFGELLVSGQNTPALRGGEYNPLEDGIHDGRSKITEDNDAIPAIQARPRRSRPIAIELPKVKRLNSAVVYTPTPPEPLSARGDRPGGYFPLHEDPTARIHRPHPFHHEKKADRYPRLNHPAEAGSMMVDRAISQPTLDVSMASSNTPVASYLPPGFHENPLPMGKYYPSNYEQRQPGQSTLRPSMAGTLASTVKSDTQIPVRRDDPSARANTQSEVRRRLQQYQREMMAQASLAASELMTGPSRTSTKSGNVVSLKDLPVPEVRLPASASLKPLAPRLIPLGSPGPVTPMELETAGGGDYLARGRRDDGTVVDALIAPTVEATTPRKMP